jgi:hypothetical protein
VIALLFNPESRPRRALADDTVKKFGASCPVFVGKTAIRLRDFTFKMEMDDMKPYDLVMDSDASRKDLSANIGLRWSDTCTNNAKVQDGSIANNARILQPSAS